MPKLPLRKPIPNPDRPGTFLVPLTRGKFAIVDACDAEAAGLLHWNAYKHRSTFYARRNRSKTNAVTMLHLLVADRMGIKRSDVVVVDHRDRNGLDCTRQNLRPATQSQNRANGNLRSNNTSGVTGVSWRSDTNRWHVYVAMGRKRRNVGYYLDKADAVRAAIAARAVIHGEFACDSQIAAKDDEFLRDAAHESPPI